MIYSTWHHYLTLLSFFASVLGLYGVLQEEHPPEPPIIQQPQSSSRRRASLDYEAEEYEAEATHRAFWAMSFAYWIVYCVAKGAQNWIDPDWTIVMLSLKWTAVLSYLLTFCCILSLPLQRMALANKQME
jgi:hypothetical protein